QSHLTWLAGAQTAVPASSECRHRKEQMPLTRLQRDELRIYIYLYRFMINLHCVWISCQIESETLRTGTLTAGVTLAAAVWPAQLARRLAHRILRKNYSWS